MTAHGYTLFDTSIGRCGIAWSDRGISGFQLPEARDSDTRARLLKRLPDYVEGTPSIEAQQAIESVVALLRGESTDLPSISLDMTGVPPFHQRVYEVARTIPPGSTLSYGEIAARLGDPGTARAVGQALGHNPFAVIVPCHRVLAAGRKIGGFSANGGATTKLRMLAIEGAHAGDTLPLFEGDGTFPFDASVAVEHLRQADPLLAPMIDVVGPFQMRLKSTSSIFAALAESIVYQQLAGTAAAAILARVKALFPHAPGGLNAAQLLLMPDEKLREAGLSRNKLLALRDLAERSEAGTIPTLTQAHGMDDEAIVAALTRVRGIGRWTVEMLLMSRLGRPDILPLDDYGVRKGLGVILGSAEMPTRVALAQHGERWRPYRTVASWYMWRAVEQAKAR